MFQSQTRADNSSGGEHSAAVVELKDVEIRLGGRVIQEDINLTVRDGEFIAILGPNGAGKSTLLKLLLGLIRPSRGSVRIMGAPAKRGNKEIGYAPQHRVLEADLALRARDVVGFGLDGNKWGPGWPSRKRDALIDTALEEVDALQFANAPVGQLSGGEQQRILIAQALLTDPRLLLLDEPLASLDISREQEIVSVIDRVCRARNVAVMLVTHDINPLLPIVDRVLYMANGRCAIGKPEEVITSEQLTSLYGSPIEVLESRGRLFVVGA